MLKTIMPTKGTGKNNYRDSSDKIFSENNRQSLTLFLWTEHGENISVSKVNSNNENYFSNFVQSNPCQCQLSKLKFHSTFFTKMGKDSYSYAIHP